jgi:hypothetical protein
MGCYTQVSVELIEKIGTLPDADNLFLYGALTTCCGAGGARGIATRTYASVQVPAAEIEGDPGSVVLEVPPFAYAVMFATASQDALFAATTLFVQVGSGSLTVLAVVEGDDMLPQPWALVGGIQSIQIINQAFTVLEFEPVFLIGV